MTNRKVFQDSITPLPVEKGLTPTGLMVQATTSEHLNEHLPVLFSLKISDEKQTELEKRVAVGEILTSEEINTNYSPGKEDVNALVSWLKEQGFSISKVLENGSGVYADGTIDQIQTSLQVNMVRVTKDGLTYTAAQNAPSLPQDIANNVHAIIGLQPFRQAKKNFRIRTPKHGNRFNDSTRKNTAPFLLPAIDNAPPYMIDEILKAYDAHDIGVSGKAETIAILIDTFPDEKDLKLFWKNNGLNTTINQVKFINVTGRPLPPKEGEETLDAEWTSGIAPSANIRIYASGSLQFVDLDRALDQIIEDVPLVPGLRQLSISLGLGETYMGGLQGEVATQHQKFLSLAALGVNIFVSSGDAGSNPDSSGHHASGPLQAEHPSSDPFVIGVGGTSLQLSVTGDVISEDAWVSSGGGQSIYFNRPEWQKGNGMPVGAMRMVPDVGLAADPDFGAYLIINGSVTQIGGTSWSAPVWAGFCALLNEARKNAGKSPLPFLNPLIYSLIGTACFREIKIGTNGAYQATSGYDMITGLGVPNLKELINSLTKHKV